MANTQMDYLYRDGDNYKKGNSVILPGEITEEQRDAIMATPNEGQWFIPAAVGLPEKRFGDWTEVDHPYFELDESDFELTDLPPTVTVSIPALVKAFQSMAGEWEAYGVANY